MKSFKAGNAALEVIRTFDEKRFSEVEYAVTPDSVVEEVATGESWKGVQGFIDEFERWGAAFSDAHSKVENVIEAPGWVIFEAVWCGTHDGDLKLPEMTIKASGKYLAFPYVTVAQIADDGRQWYSKHYYDVDTIMRQLGVD